ncbi:MAG: RsiV family protein [Fibromonadales bacterium]|nr:RsiV family protein [Fibromonadales bacterium]
MKKILLLLCAYACSMAADGNNAASNVISFSTTLLDSMGKFFFTYPTALPDSNALRELQKNFATQRFEKFPFSAKDIAASLSLYKEQNKEMEILKDQVSFPLPGIVQFVTYHYSYSSGAAHGEGGSKVGLYTLADGKKIELKNIFTKGSEKSITQLIIKEFLKMQNLQRLEDYSYTKKEADFTPVNAMISELGMDFIYPTYKLAPHSAGEQKVFLSWDALRLYLNKQSAIYQKLNF